MFEGSAMRLSVLAALIFSPALAAPAPKKPAAQTPAKPAPKTPAKPMGFAPTELDLAPGETYLTELFVPSPTGKAFTGQVAYTAPDGLVVKPDARWTGKVPPWGLKTYPRVTAAPTATGDHAIKASITKGAEASLAVRVMPPGIEPVTGLHKLTIKVTNPFRHRLMTGKVKAANPDRFLQDITTREFKVAPGETQEVEFPLPGAAPVDGEKYDFTLTVETYHGYRSEKVYSLEFPPHT
jgi:hypothetical protein